MLNQNQILKTVQTVDTTNLTVEVLTNQEKKLVKLKGKLTTNLRAKPSSDTPYYAFLRLDNSKHSLAECQQSKCQDCDIPIIFRWKTKEHNLFAFEECCRDNKKHWRKPNLDKGNQVNLTGQWAKSDHSSRPSFTVYSFRIIND